MPKLDHNLDAYRLAATTLERLRGLLRRHLEAAHGADWETAGVPDEPREFLEQRRDREASVKWNSSSGLDLLDFAGFVNLYEVLSSNPTLREGFSRLVPEPQALRLRFLELDTVLNRIAYARPVSESDMELLLGFDERLRSLASDLPVNGPSSGPKVEAPQPSKASRKPSAQRAEPPAAVPAAEPSEPAPAPAAPAPAAAKPAQAPPKAREPEPAKERPAPAPPPPARTPASGPMPVVAGGESSGHGVPQGFEAALRRGDDATILAALYQEITGLAEKIWGDASTARSPVWEAVRESSWYGNRFSTLRLRIVSDFYDLLRIVQEKVAAGSTRTELHELLKERNFAQVLMDLREFFRPIAAAGRHGR